MGTWVAPFAGGPNHVRAIVEPPTRSPGDRKATGPAQVLQQRVQSLLDYASTIGKGLRPREFVVIPLVALSFVGVRSSADDDAKTDRQPPEQATESDRLVSAYARQMIEEGRRIFRYDTFGSEAEGSPPCSM